MNLKPSPLRREFPAFLVLRLMKGYAGAVAYALPTAHQGHYNRAVVVIIKSPLHWRPFYPSFKNDGRDSLMTKSKQYSGTNAQPRIVGFVCNWSAYSGVEMADRGSQLQG